MQREFGQRLQDPHMFIILVQWVLKTVAFAVQNLVPDALRGLAVNMPAVVFGLDDKNSILGKNYTVNLGGRRARHRQEHIMQTDIQRRVQLRDQIPYNTFADIPQTRRFGPGNHARFQGKFLLGHNKGG